nr:hypothetical protein BaRGS_028927 [Batillaria attramentaria]
MRPTFDYLDRADAKHKAETAAAAKDAGDSSQDEAEEEATPVTVKFARPESEEAKARRMASYEYVQRRLEEEPWTSVRFQNLHDEQVEPEFQHLFASHGGEKTQQFQSAPADYLKQLMPPAADDKEEKPAMPDNVLSLTQLRNMPLADQVRALLTNVKVMRFSQLMELLPQGTDPQAALRLLQQVAVMFVNIIRQLYEDATCQVIHDGKLTEPFTVRTGVRQGCILSPTIFLMVVDWVMRQATDGKRTGIQWTFSKQLEDLDFADDIALLSHKQQDAQEKLNRVAEEAEKTGLKINISKTEVMRVNHKQHNPIQLHQEDIKEVDKFVYLGSVVSKDGGTDEDIKSRTNKARHAFRTLRPIWRSTALSLRNKIRIFNSNVKSVLLYGSETWRTTKTSSHKLQTFINRCLRNILNIRYPLVITNQDLWEGTRQVPIEQEIKKRKWGWIGHTLRKSTSNVTRQSLDWNPQGKRKMWKFTHCKYVVRKEISSGLPSEDVKDILEQMSRLRTSKGWEFVFNYDRDFVERHPDVVQRQRLLWDAKFQSLAKQFKMPKDADKKAKEAELALMNQNIERPRRRRASSKSSPRKRTLSGRSMSDLSDMETDGTADRKDSVDSTSVKVEPMEVCGEPEANNIHPANGPLNNGLPSNGGDMDKGDGGSMKLGKDALLKRELVAFAKETLGKRQVVSLSEVKRLFYLKLSLSPPGHILASGVSDRMLEEAFTSEEVGGYTTFGLVRQGDKTDKLRKLLFEMFEASYRVRSPTFITRVKESFGVEFSEPECKRVLRTDRQIDWLTTTKRTGRRYKQI